MKVTTAATASDDLKVVPTKSSIGRLLIAALIGFVLLMLIVILSQPQRLQRAVAELEARWGNNVYAYDRSLAEKWSIAIGNYLRDATQGAEPVPELILDVPFKGMRKIYAKREEALQIGNLIQGPDDFVKGEIRVADGDSDKTVPVKLRLKGDWNDHLAGRKWSFRVHVRNGEHLFGMRRFSLQSPATRGFQTELLFFEVMRRFGVIAPRYDFVQVTLNGDSMGLMAIEEFFAKEMVEFNRRREGVVVRFDESLVWKSKDSLAGESVGWYGAFDHFTNAAIDGIGSGRIAASPTLSKQYEIAVGQLRAFVDEKLPASDVFDVELSGRYLAIADLFGSWHAARWPNVRFYLNPITMKLEPIAYDANLQKNWTNDRSITNDEPLVAAWIADPKIAMAYRATLVELAQLVASGELITELRKVEEQPLRVLQSEYRMLGPMPLDYLQSRAELLLQRLNANGGKPLDFISWDGEERSYPVLAHMVRYKAADSTAGQDVIEISNAIPKDVEVMNLEWVDAASETATPILEDEFPLMLAPRGIGSRPERHEFMLPEIAQSANGYLRANVRLNKRPWYRQLLARPSYAPRSAAPIPRSSAAEQQHQHEFLLVDFANRQFSVRPGDWQVNQHLIVPLGYSLTLSAGAKLRFAPDAALIANGPVRFSGTATAPIELTAATQNGWPGMVVMRAQTESRLEHVIVRDTTSVVLPGWTLTGGVNFYASDVDISDSKFIDSRGEDALNIIQANFKLHDIEIRGTVSDAFDADFAVGEVNGGLFTDIGKAGGGDAIDVSGSQVNVQGTRFANVSDKALSVGERSSLDATTVIVESAGTGAAAKDGSQLVLSDSVINSASFAGLTAYMKKPEYGPARIVATDVRIVSADKPTLVQNGSVVEVDGVAAATEDVDVDALYEGVMLPGLRK